MNVFDAITTLVSVKKFDPRLPVDDKLIGIILHMATNAESAGNMQAWEFIVVKDEKIKKRLAEAALKQMHIAQAPVVIVVLADLKKANLKYQERGEILYAMQDTASAITIIRLIANVLGLGSDWIRAMDEEKVKDILGLTDEARAVGIIPIGYAAEKTEEEKRIPYENLTWVDRYKEKSMASYIFQPGTSEESFKPIVPEIVEKLKKLRKK